MSADDPIISAHAAQRWDERTPADSVAPKTAWEHAQRVAGPEQTTHTDECRVHISTGAVLLRVNHRIVTVLTERELDQDAYQQIKPVLDAGTETPA